MEYIFLKYVSLKIAIDRLCAYFVYLLLSCTVPRRTFEKTVLVVRPDGLGDLLVSLESIEMLYRHFHRLGYKVILIHSKATAPLLENCPFIDEAMCLDKARMKGSLFYKLSFYRKLMMISPMYAINYLFLPKAESLDHKLILFSRAKHKCTIDSRSFLHRNEMTLDYSDMSCSGLRSLARRMLPNVVRCEVLLRCWSMAWRDLYDIYIVPL